MFKNTKFKKFTSILCAMFTMFTFDFKVMCTGSEDDIYDEIPEYHSVLLIGPANSGKTSLKNRLDINTPFVFSNDYNPSIPGIVNYGWADVNKKGIRLIEIAGTEDERYEEAIKGVLRKPPKICLLCLACDKLEKNSDYYTRLIRKYDLASRTFICVTKCDDSISPYIADNLTKIITENGYKNEVLFTSSKINGYVRCFPKIYTGETQTTITDDMPQDLFVLAEAEPDMESISDDNKKNFKTYAGATLITAGIVSTSVILGKLISCKSKNIKNIKTNKTPKLEIPKTKKSAKLTT